MLEDKWNVPFHTEGIECLRATFDELATYARCIWLLASLGKSTWQIHWRKRKVGLELRILSDCGPALTRTSLRAAQLQQQQQEQQQQRRQQQPQQLGGVEAHM